MSILPIDHGIFASSGAGGGALIATGGTVTDYTESGTKYRSHKFTSSSNFVVSAAGDGLVDVLIVAGGGTGGRGGGDPIKQGNTAKARYQFDMDQAVKKYPRFNILRAITKRIPIVGYALGGYELSSLLLSDASKQDKIKGGAKILGGLGGAAIGAILLGTLGSYIPFVGNFVGALGGGVLGYYMGEEGMEYAMEYLLGGAGPNKDAITKKLQGHPDLEIMGVKVISNNAISNSANKAKTTITNAGGVPTSTNIKVNKPLNKKQLAQQKKEMKFMRMGAKPYAEFLASRFKGGSEFDASNLPDIQSVINENASKMKPVGMLYDETGDDVSSGVVFVSPTSNNIDKSVNNYAINQRAFHPSNVDHMMRNAL